MTDDLYGDRARIADALERIAAVMILRARHDLPEIYKGELDRIERGPADRPTGRVRPL